MTGVTSFTGMWFAETLAREGHTIVAAVRREQSEYSGLPGIRLKRLAERCELVWNAPFGSPPFIDVVARGAPFDILCHHGAQVAGYKNKDFDAVAAVESNTRSIGQVFQGLRGAGCRRIILTGSIFEEGEGAGSMPLRAFNSYGMSKALTSRIFAFHAAEQGFAFGKFVIPNPFGPYEEPRFTEYLIRCWIEGKTAAIATPRYVRDNIHVSLLAEIYADFVQDLPRTGFHRINPSGYVEPQGAFASRVAREIGSRLEIKTPLEFAKQTEFPEPPIRINTDVAFELESNWDERTAWDELAHYYARRFAVPSG
jgi:nucleoside-diphosphate-sugar epimerase